MGMNWVLFSIDRNVVMEGEVADHRMQFVERDGPATITGKIRHTCVNCGEEICGNYKHC